MSQKQPNRIRHFLAKTEIPLRECLIEHLGLSTEEADRLIAFGAVYQDRRRVTSNRTLAPGQYIRVHLQPKRFPIEGIDWKAALIQQTADFVVVHKPANVPIHATLDNQVENVLYQMRQALGESLLVTQRLDTEVSGLVVFARTPAFQRQFNQLLVDRKVRKRYRALTVVAPEVGRHVHYMAQSERGPKKVDREPHPDWLECVLRVVSAVPLEATVSAPQAFEVEIDLETGRTHQIRAQLSALGSPILGDSLYGSRTPFKVDGKRFSGIALFSAQTSWSGAEGKEWAFTLSPPWLQK